MLDHQDGDLGRKTLQHLVDHVRLHRGHARRRLIEQQHARPQRECNCDFQQALLAIRQSRHRALGDVGDADLRELRIRLLQARTPAPAVTQHAPGEAIALCNRDGDVIAHRGRMQQRVDLMGAHQAAPNACFGREPVDRFALYQYGTGIGAQNAGEQIDQGRLAGAVGADQADPCPAREIQVDGLGDGQGAKVLAQPAHRKDHVRHRAHRRRNRPSSARPPRPPRSTRLINPSSRNSTTAISMAPKISIQRNGSICAARSCTTT